MIKLCAPLEVLFFSNILEPQPETMKNSLQNTLHNIMHILKNHFLHFWSPCSPKIFDIIGKYLNLLKIEMHSIFQENSGTNAFV